MGNITSTATNTAMACSNLCSTLNISSDLSAFPTSCQQYTAGSIITAPIGQSSAGCGTNFTTDIDLCRITLSLHPSPATDAYMEVWLPNNNESSWNGRTMSTDNGGINGCVHYVDMKYVSGLGFAAIGDNGGHNSSSFDGRWMLNNNEAILDWVYRSRHAAVQIGKSVVSTFYNRSIWKSYFIGCSAGGAQGLYTAQNYPGDFDGIIAGSAAADFNHLQSWSSRFVQLTGLANTNDSRFLTYDQWILVQGAIFDQCDAAIDGVADGILEDPTLCRFNSSVLACPTNSSSNCLTDTQIGTVNGVFSDLLDESGALLYPALLYGSQVDAYRLGQLSGTVQGIARDWFRGGVWNDSSWDPLAANQTDYARADALDVLHGNISSFNGDLSRFAASGRKLMMYHGMADPLVSGTSSQRYYLKVAKTMGLDYPAIDPFMRLFRISGMAHCGVGGISGAGAWMFGQSLPASAGSDSIIKRMIAWTENGTAPDTITGTKFWYDLPYLGTQFERAHCRFPFRTTYVGGDSKLPSSWNCTLIDSWQSCAAGAQPRLCNLDGSFT